MENAANAGPRFIVLAKPSADDAIRAGRLAHGGRRGQLTVGLFVATLCVAGLLLMTPPILADFYVGLASLAIGLVYLYLTFLAGSSSRTKRRWAAHSADVVTFTFDGQGLRTDSEFQSRTVRWPAITEIRDDGQILMFLRHGGVLCWLDAASFASPADRASLGAFARARVAQATASSGLLP